MTVFCFAGCADKDNSPSADTGNDDSTKTLNVVCTMFPQYDWVRNIAGENLENINLTLLLDSGTDLHSYAPTPEDIVKISKADIFIHIGGESDKWVDGTLASANNPDLKVVNLMSLLGDDIYKVEAAAGVQQHKHEDGSHHHVYDEHIWLSPKKAIILCEAVKDALIEKDPDNKEIYEKNYNEYNEKLVALDKDYEDAVKNGTRDTVLVADRFPFVYLMNDYGIKHYAAFAGCSTESDASFETIKFLAEKTNELGLKVILITETGDETVANTIRESTSTKDQEILVLDALQSVTREKLSTSYYDVMEKNLEVIKQALK